MLHMRTTCRSRRTPDAAVVAVVYVDEVARPDHAMAVDAVEVVAAPRLLRGPLAFCPTRHVVIVLSYFTKRVFA